MTSISGSARACSASRSCASLASGVAVGLGPALQASRLSFGAVLREAAGGGKRQTRLRGALVIAQVAFSLVLLVAAGLLLRTLASAARHDPGFDPEGVEVALLDASLLRLDEAESRELFRQIAEAAAALPGAEAVSLVDRPPLALGGPGRREVEVPGYVPATGEEAPRIAIAVVGPGYFELMRTPLTSRARFRSDRWGERGAGRGDQPDHGAAVLAVRGRWRERGRGPLLPARGEERHRDRRGARRQVRQPRRGAAAVPLPALRAAAAAAHASAGAAHGGSRDRPALAAAIERLEPDLPIVLSTPLRRLIGLSLLPQRIAGTAAGVLGAVGLLLASLGVYGSVASTVRQRRRELGIHLALGAQRREVVGLVMKEGVLLAAIGVLAGTVAALGTLRFAGSLLFGISASDPATYATVAALLAVATLVASYLPARRAARLDPISTLRAE